MVGRSGRYCSRQQCHFHINSTSEDLVEIQPLRLGEVVLGARRLERIYIIS